MNTSFASRVASVALLMSVIGAAIGGALWLYERSEPNQAQTPGPTVAATIFPIADITRRIAGEHMRVIQLLPYGASEHAYSLTPQQILSIQESQALFAIGHGLDVWATEPISRITSLPIIVVDQDIDLREFDHSEEEEAEEPGHEHEEGLIDPHYWLTVPNAQQIAQNIYDELSALDPQHTSDYQANLEQYTLELDAFEKELQQKANQTAHKEFIAMHDAWSYFADHYGLRLVATYEPVEGHDPSIADLNQLREVIEHYNIRIFYSEPQKQSIGAVQLLRDEFGLAIRALDPLGGIAPYDSYINLMRTNMSALAD